MNELNDDQLFEELLNLKVEVVSGIDDEESMPIYDEYFSSKVFDSHSDEFDYIENTKTKASDSPCLDGYKQIGMKRGKSGEMVPNCVPIDEKSAKQKLKDPKGGLTAAGREYFNRTEGSNLKPGVKGAADTPEKMRRKGSFLTRFFTNPSGPMVDEKGRATRLALSAAAWGERVPKNAEDAAKLAAKGKRLLERYQNTKKKDDSESVEEKQLPGQTIGQQGGGSIGGGNSRDAIDHDGDGMINDGTPEETRAPYKRSSDSGYEKQRRKFVREQLRRQGIKANRRVEDRSKEERDARAKARAAYDKVLRGRDGKPVADGLPKGPSYPPGQSVPKKYPPGQKPEYKKPEKPRDQKPADRYPDPEKKYPPGQKPSPSKPRDQKPADRYPDPEKKYPPGQKPEPKDIKPADRYPSPSRPQPSKPADRIPDPEKKYPPGQKPSPSQPSDRKPADRYPNPGKKFPPGQKPSPSIGSAWKPRGERPESGGAEREFRRMDDKRSVGKPTIDRPRIGESRGGGRPTIDRPRLPDNQSGRTTGKNRNIRDF